jgi:hypothetical protein
MAHVQRTPDYGETGPYWWLKEFYDVTRPVGPGMPNEKADVALVQRLLNLCYSRGKDVGVDGICGHETSQAILNFQRAFSPKLKANGLQPLQCDGVVSRAELLGFRPRSAPTTPTMFTIVALNFIAGTMSRRQWLMLPFDEQTPYYLRSELVGMMP